jgi:outer membrane receptor protein involved in Fe transport
LNSRLVLSRSWRVCRADPPGKFPQPSPKDPTAAQISELLEGATLIPGTNTFGIDVSDHDALAAAVNTVIDNRLLNLGSSNLSAVDFAANYRRDFGGNAVRLGLQVTYLVDGEQKTTPSAPTIQTIDTVLRPADLKSRAYIGLSRGGMDAQLGVNYADKYRDPYAATPTSVDSWTTLDLTLRYAFQSPMLAGTSLALLAQNLLDQDPPHVQLSRPDQQAITEPVGFDPVNATPLGRFISVEVRKQW